MQGVQAGVNQLLIDARILALEPLRYTPAGVPIVACSLAHESMQDEAGQQRTVTVELQAVAAGELAKVLGGASLGMWIRGTGFLAAKSLRSRVPVLHLNKIEFLEGNENGFQAQIKVQEKR